MTIDLENHMKPAQDRTKHYDRKEKQWEEGIKINDCKAIQPYLYHLCWLGEPHETSSRQNKTLWQEGVNNDRQDYKYINEWL